MQNQVFRFSSVCSLAFIALSKKQIRIIHSLKVNNSDYTICRPIKDKSDFGFDIYLCLTMLLLVGCVSQNNINHVAVRSAAVAVAVAAYSYFKLSADNGKLHRRFRL